jgi:aryl-alcohol dehydrogenase-like predicted oxidoreductase
MAGPASAGEVRHRSERSGWLSGRESPVAERKKGTVGQVALAWLLAQKPWTVPIPGIRRVDRLDENLGSAAVELTTDDLAELDRACASVHVQGDR